MSLNHPNAESKKLSAPNTDKPRFQGKLAENVLFMVLLLSLGFFLTVQIREGISLQAQLSSSKEKQTAYLQQLSDLKSNNGKLKEENAKLVGQKDKMTEDVLNEQGYSELAESLTKTRELAGLTEVTGSGITITLNDSSITDASDVTQTSLIHSQDVEYIIDLLKLSGAKAIAINGERIVSTTIIVCTGPTIRVNNSRYPVPFVITAICNANDAYDILQNDSHIIFRKSEGIAISFEKKDTLSVPPFSDSTVIDSISKELEVINQS